MKISAAHPFAWGIKRKVSSVQRPMVSKHPFPAACATGKNFSFSIDISMGQHIIIYEQ